MFASQAQNPHWRWYAEAHGPIPLAQGYHGFLMGRLPKVKAEPPTDLPTSRLFKGTGQAILNLTLLDAKKNVQVLFKSSPMGTQSHGYEAQNAFLLNVFGERLLIRSGRRDIHGSVHHKNWQWETKSDNSILVDGKGQKKHHPTAVAEITEFHTSDRIDYVAGEAGPAYGSRLDSFKRRILFVKPDLIVIFDTLKAPKPSTFDWMLHANSRFTIEGQEVTVEGKVGAARIRFLAPENLTIVQTDRFDPPPRPRVKLSQWHLKASTKEPAAEMSFITLIRPYRKGAEPPGKVSVDGSTLRAGDVSVVLGDRGRVKVLLSGKTCFESDD
jgi:hypothetical protein